MSEWIELYRPVALLFGWSVLIVVVLLVVAGLLVKILGPFIDWATKP